LHSPFAIRHSPFAIWHLAFGIWHLAFGAAFGLPSLIKNHTFLIVMRRILLSAALIFFASAKLHATEALLFDGGGYRLYILIGISDQPVVAQVRFTAPGAKDWVHLPREQLQIEKFDFGNILIMRFSNQNDPELPSSFSFSVKKDRAVLSIKGKKIKSSFNWDI
jgi:hypothetical protein